MEKGISNNTSYVLRYIAERKDEVNSYIDGIVKKSYVSFETEDEIIFLLNNVLNSFLEELNLDEQQDLRRYTGLEFREINAILRNCWNYDVNGKLTDELKEKYVLLAEKIRKIFVKAKPLPTGINTYRGVSLLAFQSYGIFKLADLVYLKNQFLYEEGFISTSLIKKKSFYYDNPFTLTGKPNILIEYLVPEGSDDGIIMMDDTISLSPNQDEFLIKSSSLSKVLDVTIDEKTNTAFLKVLLIPEKVWNYQDYINERQNMSNMR